MEITGSSAFADDDSKGIQVLRYTHTRAGGMFIQMRSEASTEKPPNRFGSGEATD